MYVYIDIYKLYALYYCPNTTGMTHLKIKVRKSCANIFSYTLFLWKNVSRNDNYNITREQTKNNLEQYNFYIF